MASTPVTSAANLSHGPFYWGIDVGGTGIKIGLVDSVGTTVIFERIDTRESEGPDAAIQRVIEVIRQSENQVEFFCYDIVGITKDRNGKVKFLRQLPGKLRSETCSLRTVPGPTTTARATSPCSPPARPSRSGGATTRIR